MHPKNISINNYTYTLPNDKIAKFPLPKRDESKLLVYENKTISESIYCNIASYIPANSLLIFNNTKVVEARILFEKGNQSFIEVFCLEPEESYTDITIAMLQKKKVLWKCLVGGAKKWKEEWLLKKHNNVELRARIAERKNDYFLIEFDWSEDICFAEILHEVGVMPLPPYLNRNAEQNDAITYQTIYAKHDGSVAAPTAGLHFTNAVFESFKNKKIDFDYITLHVGAGTFKPVKSSTLEQHEMHSEFIDVHISVVENLLEKNFTKIIAVGTTSLRTIESLYWIGVKISMQLNFGRKIEDIELTDLLIRQWDVYDLPKKIIAKDAIQQLINWMKIRKMERLVCKTQILIAPPYQLKIANGIITNFHQPQSTLLLIIAAIVGDDWKKIYHHALENNFRFLSYGDGCLLWK